MRKIFKWIILVSLFLLGNVGSIFAFSNYNFQPPATVIPPSFFGMHIHHVAIQPPHIKQITPWPEIPFSKLRLWGAYVEWPNLEPEKGKWNFELLDKYYRYSSKT